MPTSYALAVDLGGTKVEAALVDEQGVVLAASRHRAPTGPVKTAEELADSVRTVVTRARASLPAGDALLGVGIGTAGPITVDTGTVSPLNLPAWRDYPLRDCVAALVPEAPVRLRLDGLCITLAEHWLGAGRGADSLMGMVVSTGIGGGLILGGSTVSGPTGNAGHIGHIEVGGFDDACACGGTGCLEAVASGPRTVAWARAEGWSGLTGEDLSAAYAAGDPIAISAVKRCGQAIGQAIASATNLVDLDVVAIGGGFSHVTPDLFDYVRAAVAERTVFSFATRVRVVASALSGDGPLIGAAALIHRADLVA
ncbi:ROK family protein [Cryobacterium sp. TMT1-62]|uniref:ROK family protein n=1 Tax=unclassified Cryobacterium TaxID=2649013 RepID=UPI000CE573E9|nr:MULTISPECIES: ROK family protein [unclassified Cryobacterium]TFB57329.1 ROK family protein [Cryobacterium sp. Sr3]TFB64630.1 ROK family protein [Cryobacterium sp. Hz7]TFC34059.1 ROK family protein [Cryobacterium sp. TMT2-14]TFD30230.1 ROK family protein [Cryobacterium sp. TMT1-62]